MMLALAFSRGRDPERTAESADKCRCDRARRVFGGRGRLLEEVLAQDVVESELEQEVLGCKRLREGALIGEVHGWGKSGIGAGGRRPAAVVDRSAELT